MKIAFHTLGCKVNQYESEAIIEKFKTSGHQIVAETDEADVYIINTCTVTGLADRKSRQFVRKFRNMNANCLIVVTGCYAQMQPEEIAAIEGVNIVAGTNEKADLVRIVEEYANSNGTEIHRKKYEELTEFEEIGSSVTMETRTRAHIKIQDGCNRFCSYCIVPYARGNIRSREKNKIIEEAKKLIASGYKEIVLTGINTALYKTEDGLASGQGLVDVLTALEEQDGEFRIRLSSLEPTVVNSDTIGKFLHFKRLCPHFHLSLQSGSDTVLRAMKRDYTAKEYLEIVEKLKKHDPGFAITTDIIVGFPGETHQDFLESCRIVEQAGFSKIHVFKYSKRTGTPAATMGNQISGTIKNQRSAHLIALGHQLEQSFFQRNSGTIRQVLVEHADREKGMLSGYTDNYIRVYIPTQFNDTADWENEFILARLQEPYADGMIGEYVSR